MLRFIFLVCTTFLFLGGLAVGGACPQSSSASPEADSSIRFAAGAEIDPDGTVLAIGPQVDPDGAVLAIGPQVDPDGLA